MISTRLHDRPAVRVGLTLWAASWLGFELLAWFATPPSRPRWIFDVYARWDSGHFARIQQFGILSRGRGDVNAAFFPGYPIVARYVATGLGLGHATALDRAAALALVAWAGAALAAVLLWQYALDGATPTIATVSVLLLLCGPYALFFVASYSEGLFLALALAAWLCARNQRSSWAGIFCAAAVLVRVNGLFLLVGLIVLPAPVAALTGYLTWLRANTGHWDAWLRAEKLGWHRHNQWPWLTFAHSVRYLQHASSRPVRLDAAMELVFAALYLIALFALFRQRLWPEFSYVGLTAASLLTSTAYESVPRSMIVCFPICGLIARWCTRTRHRWLVAVAGLLTLSWTATDAVLFVRGYPVG
jgi:hypothetical protein